MSDQQNFGFGKFVPGFDFLPRDGDDLDHPPGHAGADSCDALLVELHLAGDA